jgi:hypothetical protein
VNSSSKSGRYTWIILIAFTGAVVVMLAYPRLQASIRYLPVEIAIDKYYATNEIPSDRLPVLIRFTEEALQKNDHYRFHDGLSILHLLRTQDINTPPAELRGAYVSAMTEAEESLKGAPAQPAVWLRLARLRWTLHEETEDVIAAWKMSIFTGRNASNLFAQRVEIGLAYHAFLDEEAVSMLRDQLLLAWRLKPGAVIQVIASRDPQLNVTRPLIVDSNPDALNQIEEWIARIR